MQGVFECQCHLPSQIFHLPYHPWSPSFSNVEIPRVKHSTPQNLAEFSQTHTSVALPNCTFPTTVSKHIFKPSLQLKIHNLTKKIDGNYIFTGSQTWISAMEARCVTIKPLHHGKRSTYINDIFFSSKIVNPYALFVLISHPLT